MGNNIVIPEDVFEEFLRSLFAKVTRDQQELAAEMLADVEVCRAQLKAGLESKMRKAEEIERRVRAVEDRLCAAEDELERKLRAAEDQIARKRREAEDEIARLRQLERLRQTAAIERGERPQ